MHYIVFQNVLITFEIYKSIFIEDKKYILIQL